VVHKHLDADGKPKPGTVEALTALVRELAEGVRAAARPPASP